MYHIQYTFAKNVSRAITVTIIEACDYFKVSMLHALIAQSIIIYIHECILYIQNYPFISYIGFLIHLAG